ncbi:MAG: radical SAM protein [Candidatus Colwellbacteria bacterium]|nr:radical SAM protein [Candidatus Colwellbacteria bacterium]
MTGRKESQFDNPFPTIIDACQSGTMAEKMAAPLPFPRMLDVELTNVCNMRCQMCPVGCRLQTRPVGYMTIGTLHSILREAKKYRTPIRFIRWGEPLLHYGWAFAIRSVVDAGLACHLNTNGLILTDLDSFGGRNRKQLINSGLTSLKISFQGTDPNTYQLWRGKNLYAALMEALKDLRRLRGGRRTPVLQVGTTITTESELLVRTFREEVAPFAEACYVGHTVDMTATEEVPVYGQCPEVFDKLSVNWNGIITPCCSDWNEFMNLGRVPETSLKQAWNSKALRAIREDFLAGQFDRYRPCRNCPRFPRARRTP